MVAHWYMIYIYECPVCGRTKQYKERRTGPRPIRWNDREV